MITRELKNGYAFFYTEDNKLSLCCDTLQRLFKWEKMPNSIIAKASLTRPHQKGWIRIKVTVDDEDYSFYHSKFFSLSVVGYISYIALHHKLRNFLLDNGLVNLNSTPNQEFFFTIVPK